MLKKHLPGLARCSVTQTLTALAEDQSSGPNTHVRQLTTSRNSSSRAVQCLWPSLWTSALTCEYPTYTFIIKNQKVNLLESCLLQVENKGGETNHLFLCTLLNACSEESCVKMKAGVKQINFNKFSELLAHKLYTGLNFL